MYNKNKQKLKLSLPFLDAAPVMMALALTLCQHTYTSIFLKKSLSGTIYN
jgi:hypothetical protein